MGFNIKNFVLGIGIIVIFGLALWQGSEAFYPSPQYEDFCGEFRTAEVIESQERCEEIGGKWNADGIPRPVKADTGETIEVAGFCDRDFTCRQEFEDAGDSRASRIFFISLIAGVIVLVAGYSILAVEPVGSALIVSGIWSIFWGSAINWRNFSDIWRFLLLLIVLILLIWFALRLNRKGKKKNNWMFWKK